eukprot:6172031-Pleurochrysis_carterae.AAC.1
MARGDGLAPSGIDPLVRHTFGGLILLGLPIVCRSNPSASVVKTAYCQASADQEGDAHIHAGLLGGMDSIVGWMWACLAVFACAAAGKYRDEWRRAQREAYAAHQSAAEIEAAMLAEQQEADLQLQEAVETARSEFFDYEDIIEIGRKERLARIEADKKVEELEAEAAKLARELQEVKLA